MNKYRILSVFVVLAMIFSFANVSPVSAGTPGDIDGDGVPDEMDPCPYDPLDDSDGDGICDSWDAFPNDPTEYADSDGDGLGDNAEYMLGTDPYNADSDGDGVNDGDEVNAGTDPVGTLPDSDGDGVPDVMDPCPNDPFDDSDSDGVCDGVDNAPNVPNPSQSDIDGDGVGDVIDMCVGNDFVGDTDGDGLCDDLDSTPTGSDIDGDGIADNLDACPNDPLNDIDGDGLCGDVDNAPNVFNPSQSDIDGDGVGDAADVCPFDPQDDADGDGVCGDVDNAPNVPNSDQSDSDGDGVGDVADACPFDPQDDADGDGVCGDVDNAPGVANSDQSDNDNDGVGDVIDMCLGDDSSGDSDGDGVCDDIDAFPTDATESADNDGDGVGDNGDIAPNTFNPDQSDLDNDGIADVDDVCPNDALDQCDPDGSASSYLDAEAGGTLSTPDSSVTISLPPGAATSSGSISITDSDDGSSGFELTSNRGKVLGLYSVDFQPSQTFNSPVVITFVWDDVDNDGIVDGTNTKEENLIITKNSVIFTDKCKYEPVGDGALPDCDTDANTFTFETLSWSEFTLAYTNDPIIESVSAALDPVRILDQTFAIGAEFTDADDDDNHTVKWIWGDGTTSQGTVDQANNIASGNHIYAKPGIYTVSVVLSDAFPNTADAIYQQFVVVYDPSGGFVTGGGWINSPAGAYKADETLSGKATFGFVAKYKKGATVPDGNTEFHFKAAGFNFHSDTYEWLVVNQGGANAQFRGEGMVNGALDSNGNAYKFMIWAGDDSSDTFRIRIWSELDGVETVVYDNGFDQELGGGSIVIHQK